MYSTNGKEILRAGQHFGDAGNIVDADIIAKALNAIEAKPAPVEPFDYIAEANVTLSNQYHGNLVSEENLRAILINSIERLRELDKVKKALFYGRDADLSGGVAGLGKTNAFAVISDVDPTSTDTSEILIHGIIGVATEAGELLEALLESFKGYGPIDKVNVKEEVGDMFWYIAILAKACGFSFDDCQRVNIAKLRSRFPNAFTEHDANNRDLATERAILEGPRSADHLNVI